VDEEGDIISCNLCTVQCILCVQDPEQKPKHKVYKISAKVTEEKEASWKIVCVAQTLH
jgi:hypothetical protein